MKHFSTINFAYFAANFPPDFIKEVWPGHFADHLESKLNGLIRLSSCDYVSVDTFMKFFYELGTTNQIILLDWIESNYNFAS